MTHRWFWVLVFLTAGLASCFAMLASIIHFQILGAVAFFFLMAVCWGSREELRELKTSYALPPAAIPRSSVATCLRSSRAMPGRKSRRVSVRPF